MIIFDLDNVLCDTSHRRHFIDVDIAIEKEIAYEDVYCNIGGVQSNGYFLEEDPDRRWKPDIEAYDNACDGDDLIEPVWTWTDLLFTDNQQYSIWTGRCESVKEKTIKWLALHEIEYVDLKMRPIGNTEPAWKLKEKWLLEICKIDPDHRPPGVKFIHDIDFVFDADPDSIAMWKRRGIFVFEINQKAQK